MDNSTILKGLADNPLLLEATKALFDKQFSLANLTLEGGLTNEQIGQETRARIEGKKLVDEVFKEIERHKTVQAKAPSHNRAR